MNEPFSIVPPPELVKQWVTEVWHEGTPARLSLSDMHIAGQAATWGADQQLDRCCKSLDDIPGGWGDSRHLRHVCRPKPQSLNSIALQMLDTIERDNRYLPEIIDTIKRALKENSDD
jgi:hypothetical protein